MPIEPVDVLQRIATCNMVNVKLFSRVTRSLSFKRFKNQRSDSIAIIDGLFHRNMFFHVEVSSSTVRFKLKPIPIPTTFYRRSSCSAGP